MSELEDQINRILSDPGQMEMISGLARSLMGGGEDSAPASAPSPSAAPSPDAGPLKKLSGMLQTGDKGKEAALLEAMKPWLSEKRRNKMDRAMKIARMARLARMAMGEMGGGDHDQSL